MKGRKLTLQEVLNLEDGTKVWVENSNPNYSCLCYLNLVDRTLEVCDDVNELYIIDEDLYVAEDNNDVEFYEWIEDSEIVEIKSNVPICCSTCYKLSEEICKLRGLDLTDDNIRLIVEEFS